MTRTFTLLLAVTQAVRQQQAVAPYTLTNDRGWATAAAVLALVGAIIGGMALVRFAGRIGPGQGRNGATVAVTAGLIAALIGGLLLATADGGPGTGNGVVGAAAALVLGLVGVVEGGLVLARTRRAG
jgi:hypothetical protein